MLNPTIKEMLLASIAVFAFFACLEDIEQVWLLAVPYLVFWVVRSGFLLRRVWELFSYTTPGYRATCIYASLYFGVLGGLMASWFLSSPWADGKSKTVSITLVAVIGVIYGGTRFTRVVAEQGTSVEEDAFRKIGFGLAWHAAGVTLWMVLCIWGFVLTVAIGWLIMIGIVGAGICYVVMVFFDLDESDFGIRVVFTRLGVWIRKIRPGGDGPRRHRWRR